MVLTLRRNKKTKAQRGWAARPGHTATKLEPPSQQKKTSPMGTPTDKWTHFTLNFRLNPWSPVPSGSPKVLSVHGHSIIDDFKPVHGPQGGRSHENTECWLILPSPERFLGARGRSLSSRVCSLVVEAAWSLSMHPHRASARHAVHASCLCARPCTHAVGLMLSRV